MSTLPPGAGSNGTSRRASGLRTRFLGAVVVATMVFAFAASALSYLIAQRRESERASLAVAALAGAVERTAAIGVYAGDEVLLAEVADGLLRHELIAMVEIRDIRDRVLIHRANEQAAQTSGGESGPVLHLLYSPFNAAEQVATLKVVLDEARVTSMVRRDALAMASMIGAQSLVVAMLIAWLSTSLVVMPVTRLAGRFVDRRSGPGETLRIPLRHAGDEIGVLIESANDWMRSNRQALEREQALRQSVERLQRQYQSIFESSSAGIFVADGDGRMLAMNATVARLFGVDASLGLRLSIGTLLKSLSIKREDSMALVAETIATGAPAAADIAFKGIDGREGWLHCVLSARRSSEAAEFDSGDPRGDHLPDGELDPARAYIFEGVVYDVTDRRLAELNAHQRADADPLTRLTSRDAAERELDMRLARPDAELTLMFIDLDGFKQVNDRHGHAAGDTVLIETGRRLRQQVRREGDIVARLGGDEFLVCLPDLDSTDDASILIATRVLKSLGEPIRLDNGAVVSVGASIGLASAPRHGRDRQSLMRAADEAMYSVKHDGKRAIAIAGSGQVLRAESSRPEVDRTIVMAPVRV